MVDLTILTNSNQPTRHQEMVVYNKYGKLKRQLYVTLLTPLYEHPLMKIGTLILGVPDT